MSFVIGRNGSGQRTIFTALVIGLGASASSIDKEYTLHSFIKKGINSASVEIKVKNNSPNAYKHDVYGDMITIIRTINSSGSSNFKIKSTSGEIISSKPDEVAKICSVHNIQVDNPVCVLNQADARYFRAVDSKIKYGYFKKATNVDIVLQNYNRALSSFVKSNDTLARKDETLLVLEKEVKKLKSPHEKLKFRDKIENRLKSVEKELYWNEIMKFKASFQNDDNERLKREEKIKNYNRALNDCLKSKEVVLKESFTELEEMVEQLKLVQNEEMQTQDDVELQSENRNNFCNDMNLFPLSMPKWKYY